ncbi:hypothetical protein HPB47_021681 [Ixodes persulcatus]|uniref:Uncharacterized protein n=1 Tax=Ixodes persulcatus TaxID=34615 RepID=A0AC60QBZ2_IXOPE|nr:hypothetical protein HPB47_021681 [Ixodes persulcatus]
MAITTPPFLPQRSLKELHVTSILQVQLGNPHLEIVAARRMGRSKAILVTVGGNEVPSYLCYGPIICQFYEYRERKQACTSCRQMGHRADTCPQGESKLCPNCGVEHELPPIVDGKRAYTCTPICVICGGKHFTGSKECNKRYVPRQKVKPREDCRHRSPSGEFRARSVSLAIMERKLAETQQQLTHALETIQQLSEQNTALKSQVDTLKGQGPVQSQPPSQEEPAEEVRRRKKARCPDSPEEDKTLTAITELAKAVNSRFQQLDEHLTERFQKMEERSQQWNGGGLGTKINALRMHLFSSETQPDVIAIQESSENCKIPGYTRYEQSNGNIKRPIHTFVRRDIPVKQHDVTLQGRNGLVVVELLPKKKKELSTVICNTYSSPKEHGTDVAEVFPTASSIAAGGPVVVLGDFNAPCIGWGYRHDTSKGKAIERQASLCSMVLLNDLTHPTRCGNSITRDTNPDLTYAANVSGATWSNTLETLGSDHYILEIRVDTCIAAPRGVTICLLTDWDKFRDRRRDRGPIDSLGEWIKQLNDDQRAVTREVTNPTQAKSVDTKLAHMLEAYASLHRRWKTTGKSNRKLRRRLALLFRDIEQQAAYLVEQQWTQMCDGLKGQLHTRSPWSLFRHLLNPDESKLEHNKALIRLLRELPGDEASICSELRERYLDAPPLQVSPSQRYEGDPNPTIDRPIEEAEPDWRRAVVVKPLPRNMSTTHHKQRREARARALQRLQEDDPRAFHVDASPYPDRSKCYVAAVHNISGSYTATIKACDIHEAEEAAIAIGLLAASRTGSSGTVTTDSKTAATSFLYGRIGSPARKILRSFRTPRDKNSRYHVVWVPAHAGHEGNEAAHSLASRVATSRDCEEEGGREFSLGEHSYAAPATEEAPTRFCDATRVERKRRRVLPPPHPELNHLQARRWRQLQTLAIQTPRFLRRVHPLLFDGSCTRCCGSVDPPPDGTIGHMFWSCPKFQPPQELQRHLDDRGEDIVPHWTSLLQSDELRIQLLLIDRTEQVVRDLQDELRKRRAQL